MHLKDLKSEDYHIYVDLDGVLANLLKKMREVTGHELLDNNKHDQAAWKEFHDQLRDGQPFFAELELLPDANQLWDYVKKYKPNICAT